MAFDQLDELKACTGALDILNALVENALVDGTEKQDGRITLLHAINYLIAKWRILRDGGMCMTSKDFGEYCLLEPPKVREHDAKALKSRAWFQVEALAPYGWSRPAQALKIRRERQGNFSAPWPQRSFAFPLDPALGDADA